MKRFLSECSVILGIVLLGICYTFYLFVIFSVLSGWFSVLISLLPVFLVLAYLGKRGIK